MVSQKVVLSGTRTDQAAEVELGPFNQGILIVFDSTFEGVEIVDVASGNVIVVLDGVGDHDRTFIQTYPSDAPLHPHGITRTMTAACLGREFEISLFESLERRLRVMADEVDAEFDRNGMERLERDEGGSFTDEALGYCILTAISRGLEAYEDERGVEARPDGTVVPREETT